MSINDEYQDLLTKVKTAAQTYYNNPLDVVVSDEEYDIMVDRITELEAQDPSLRSAESPTAVVGAAQHGSDVTHEIPMQSLLKVTTQEEVDGFVLKNVGFVSVEPKCDGASLSLTYKKGKLVVAATRGDGTKGTDVTEHAKYILGVPQELPDEIDLTVRGEAIIFKADFEKINESGEYKSARNLVAGTLNGKDSKLVGQRMVRMLTFDVLGDFEDSKQGYVYATRAGFEVARPIIFTRDVDEVWAHVENLIQNRDSLPFEIDGVVIKMTSAEGRKYVGSRSNTPRWAIAYKPADATKTTKLKEVIWQVGKTGTVAPVAIFDPVELDSATLERATLHNLKEIRRLDLRVGDTVIVARMKSVIPGIVGRVEADRDGTEQVIEAPTSCPSCSGSLETYGNSMQLRCVNPDCGAKNVRKLMHWASRSGADIDAIGENWIEEFSQAGLLNSIRDFYLLTGEDMLQFDNMGIERACKFMDSIEASKQVGMKKALIGLSIPQLGEGTATRLCNEFASVAEVMNATMADLWAVQDIGPSAASAISDHFRDGEVREVIIALIDLGVNLDRLPEDAPLELVSDAVFSGKTVVITGSLSVERADFKKLLEAHGAKVTGSVSKRTDLLVIGSNVGMNKINAAKKNGTAVIDEATARQAMNL